MKEVLKSLFLISVFSITSCVKREEQKAPAEESNLKQYDDFGYPLLTEGTLHNVTVTEKGRTFAKNGQTAYKIVYESSDEGASKSASFISSNVYNATGARLELIKNSEFNQFLTRSSKYIVVGCKDIFESVGKKMPTNKEFQEECGFYISSYGDSVFLMANRYGGFQHGTLQFLKHLVGYDMIVEDTVIYEKDGSTLPDMEIIESPDFQWAHPTNNFTTATRYGLGYSASHSMITVPSEDPSKPGKTVHNVFTFIDPDIHGKYDPDHPELYHPEWFSDGFVQLCYNAHGDANSLELMVETAFEQVKRAVESNNYAGIINFTDNDNRITCTCEACTKCIAHDGSISGSIIRFVNKLDDKLQVYLQQKAAETHTEKRKVHLQFFAYLSSEQPPTLSVQEDPTLRCNDDVMVMIAPIHAYYMDTFYDESNQLYANTIAKWREYCSNSTAWVYETNYHFYMFPFNTYSTMMINYRYFKSMGASVMLNEGQRYSKNVTCFGKLKEYLCSKAQFDVNANYNFYTDKFFNYYFKEAAPIMREYYEQMNSWLTYIESRPEIYGLDRSVYENVGAKAEAWPKQMLVNWLAMMDEAYKAVEQYKNVDTSLYNKLRFHILVETLFPKYALCDLHAGTYTAEQILEMRKAFKADATETGLVEHMEHYSIDAKYAEWGI